VSGYALGQPYGVGAGFQQVVKGVAPAAGSSFTFVNSGFFRSRLIGCVFTLTTSATVANRYATVEVLGDDNVSFNLGGAGVVVTANSTQRFAGSMYRGQGEWATGTDVLFPLLPLYLEEGVTLKINVGAIDTIDTLTLIRLAFDRFPTSDAWQGFLASDAA
jgi:hypothetical protein